MATVVNACDVLLQAATTRTTVVASNLDAYLTKPTATLAANPAGTISSFAPASGVFKLSDAGIDRTGSVLVSYSVVSSSGCAVSIDGNGAYSVSSLTADLATATLRATYGGVTLDLPLSLTRMRLVDVGYGGDTNATNGAPAGTNVGSTPATTVESNAAAGASANTAITNKPTATISSTVGASYANGVTNFGNITVNITGTGPFKISWALNDDSSELSHLGLSAYSGATVGLSHASGPTSNTTYGCNPIVTVTDANGIATTASTSLYFTQGTPP